MKAATLYQPWATLTSIRAKRIETRSFSTKYRGQLAIHASRERKYIDMYSKYYVCDKEPFYSILMEIDPFDLMRGAVIAICELTDCLEIILPFLPTEQTGKLNASATQWSDIHYFPNGFLPISNQERSFGDYTPGRFMWMLGNVRELKHPIPAKGARRLWEWTPPQELVFK